jgi:hypothetical protein
MKRKLNIGFANGMETSKILRCDRSQILVPAELESNPNADKRTDTWLDLARYARHVLAAVKGNLWVSCVQGND